MPPRPPPGTRAGETLLEIRLTTLDGRPVPVLLKEVALCVRYSAGDLEPAEGDASRLQLGRFDASRSGWELPDPALDTHAGTICIDTLRLSIWMVFAKIPGVPAAGGLRWWWTITGIGGGLAVLLGGLWLLRGKGPGGGALRQLGSVRESLSQIGQPPRGAGAPADDVSAPEVDHVARATSHLQRVQEGVARAVSRLGSQEPLDGSMGGDITMALEAAVQEIRECSQSDRGPLLALLSTTAVEGEAALEWGIDQALDTAPVSAVADLFEAIRGWRLAQFIAAGAGSDPTYLEEAPSIVGLVASWRIDVRFSGRIRDLRGRSCVVAGVSVILPQDEVLLGALSEGMYVYVEGVLGPKATVFATSVRVSSGPGDGL